MYISIANSVGSSSSFGSGGLAAPVATAATGVGATSFTANWEAYTGAVVYLLDVSESSDFSTFVYENQEVNAPTTSYVVIGLNPNTTYYYRVRASTESLTDADYQAVLDYATTQGYTLPSASQQALQNQLVVDLKDAGIWSKLDTFYVFATDADSDFASINWKDPNNFEITEVNSPTFTTDVGFTGNGTSSYINTNYIPGTDGINYSQNNASMMYYRENNANAITFITGNELADRYNFCREDNNTRIWFNSDRSVTPADGTGAGFFMLTRDNSSTSIHYKGTSTTILDNPSTGLGISSVLALTGSSSSGFSSSTIQLLSLGADLNSEASDFKTSIDSYLTSI